MIKGIISFIGGLFTNDRAADTIIDIVRNKTGANDLTDKERVQALLDHNESTKHQSPTRRAIALAILFGIMLFTGTWLLVGCLEYLYVFFMTDTASLARATETANTAKLAVQPLTQFRNQIVVMMETVLKTPFSIVLGFYYATAFIGKAKG